MTAFQYLKNLIEQGLPLDGDPYLVRGVREGIIAIEDANDIFTDFLLIRCAGDLVEVTKKLEAWRVRNGLPIKSDPIINIEMDRKEADREDEVKGR